MYDRQPVFSALLLLVVVRVVFFGLVDLVGRKDFRFRMIMRLAYASLFLQRLHVCFLTLSCGRWGFFLLYRKIPFVLVIVGRGDCDAPRLVQLSICICVHESSVGQVLISAGGQLLCTSLLRLDLVHVYQVDQELLLLRGFVGGSDGCVSSYGLLHKTVLAE